MWLYGGVSVKTGKLFLLAVSFLLAASGVRADGSPGDSQLVVNGGVGHSEPITSLSFTLTAVDGFIGTVANPLDLNNQTGGTITGFSLSVLDSQSAGAFAVISDVFNVLCSNNGTVTTCASTGLKSDPPGNPIQCGVTFDIDNGGIPVGCD